MRLHSDILIASYISAATPAGVGIDIAEHGSRSRARAYDCRLYWYGERDALHRRAMNSGNRGARESWPMAATWDEWGVWMAALYALDDAAIIPPYSDYAGFIADTRRHRENVRAYNRADSLAWRTHCAPWIDAHDAARWIPGRPGETLAARAHARYVADNAAARDALAAELAASVDRAAERERIAVAIAHERYAGDNVDVFGVSLAEYRDGGYWIAGRFWIDADDVESRAPWAELETGPA